MVMEINQIDSKPVPDVDRTTSLKPILSRHPAFLPVMDKESPEYKRNEEFLKRLFEEGATTSKEILELLHSMCLGKDPYFRSHTDKMTTLGTALSVLKSRLGDDVSPDLYSEAHKAYVVLFAMTPIINDTIARILFPSEENGGVVPD